MKNIIHKIKIIFPHSFSLLLIAGSLFLFSDCKRTSDDLEMLGAEYVSAPDGFFVNGGSFTQSQVYTRNGTLTSSVNSNIVTITVPPFPVIVATAGVSVGNLIFNSNGAFIGTVQSITSTQLTLTSNALIDVNGDTWGSAAPTAFAFPTPINFLSQSVLFNASFSSKVTWTITITGTNSGAVKIITGLSDTLKSAFWKGESSNIYFFNKENAVAVLSFLGSSLTYTDTIFINKPKKYDANIINGVKHLLLDDFDGFGIPIEGSYKDAGDGSTNVFGAAGDIKVQGNYSFRFAGTDLNANTWLSGINTEPIDVFFGAVAATDPEQVFFNIYVYGTGKESSSIQLKAYEVDQPYTTDVYDQSINDGYVYDIIINWIGWKLISVRYSEFKRANDPMLGGNGNGIKEPNKIGGVNIGLNSQPLQGKEVEAYVDFFILTEGGRFIP